MEAKTNPRRAALDGSACNGLFPPASGKNETIKKYADLSDTVRFIPKAVQSTLYHTVKLAPILKAATLRQTCSNIWHFLYGHIKYLKDEEGKEQIRSPARAWRDRKSGIDCDCFSVFVSSILTNLGIPHLLRITKYSANRFQHIYPVVPVPGGYITMDCVTDYFDYEVPYSEKKDFKMELQFLNGFENEGMGGDGLAELGRLLKNKMGKGSPAKAMMKTVRSNKQRLAQRKTPNVSLPGAAAPTGYDVPKPKKKKFFGKLLNVVNKVNPATLLLRNGILASMKLNVRNLAGRLRWTYLTPQQAAAKEIDPAKFQKLVAARMRLEKIFFGAGGKPANLRKAILGGKGNKDKAVNGFDGLEGYPFDMSGMNEYTPMDVLLGADIYHEENVEGMEGFAGLGELGEPITLSSIAAAAAVVAGIVGMIKEVGSIFKKKDAKGAEDFDEEKNEAADRAAPEPVPLPAAAQLPPAGGDVDSAVPGGYPATIAPANMPSGATYLPETKENATDTATVPAERDYTKTNLPVDTGEKESTGAQAGAGSGGNNGEPEKTGFWEKNKTWLKPVGIGLGAVTILGLAYTAMRPKQTGHAPRQYGRGNSGLSGVPGRKKNHKRPKAKKKHGHKRAIGLFP